MHRFDYSFLKSVIPGNIVGLSDVISDLRSKEEFRKIQYTDAFETLHFHVSNKYPYLLFWWYNTSLTRFLTFLE